MLKKGYFWKKKQNLPSVGGSAPKLSLASGGWGLCPQTMGVGSGGRGGRGSLPGFSYMVKI